MTDLDFNKILEFKNMMFNNWNGSHIKGDIRTKDRKGVCNSYEIFNKQIEELQIDFNFNILDIFKQKEYDEEEDKEGEQQEINYINCCFDSETNEKNDNIEYMGRNIFL